MTDAKLILGDCREKMREMESDSVDMIFTDPPYGHNNNDGDLAHNREKALGHELTGAKAEDARPILNDSPKEAEIVFKGFLKEAKRVLVPGGCCCCCCCGGGGPDPQFARWSLWLDAEIPFKHAIVWDKGGLGMGWHYRRNYEFVLVAQKQGAACKWYDETNSVPNIIKGIRKIIPSQAQHPTEKPFELAAWFIRLHSREGEIVLDPFMGSGSTGVAALRLGRNFMGIELDEKYYRMAEARIRNWKGQTRLNEATGGDLDG
ncbi:MAG: site-specific DNA-methyltransferase [Candidatus Omnitrophica bacterium]|nr:site-specific DNA-methyltransferase [Candidatus Omnitrophota bacterium]